DLFEAKVYDEVENIRAKINDRAVCERASELNSGVTYKIEHPLAWGRGSLMGYANYYARIRFTENSSVWLIRVPRINSSIPQSLVNYLIRSEYVTLKFLETTKVPAPWAFDYRIVGDNKNQVGTLAANPKHNLVEATEQFYLKHVDDKGDHLMVDDELNIIRIID
ncbi:uncharacterized protein N7498_001667, partial [Penicillium cinerascens]